MEKLGLEFDSEFENEGFRLVKYAIDRARYAGPGSAGVRFRQNLPENRA
jgi:hypothetical protein